MANQLLAACTASNDESERLRLLIREGQSFTDAATAREDAVRLAVGLHDRAALRVMSKQSGWLESADPLMQHQAGVQLQDVWIQWSGLFRHRIAAVPWRVLLLVMFY